MGSSRPDDQTMGLSGRLGDRTALDYVAREARCHAVVRFSGPDRSLDLCRCHAMPLCALRQWNSGRGVDWPVGMETHSQPYSRKLTGIGETSTSGCQCVSGNSSLDAARVGYRS